MFGEEKWGKQIRRRRRGDDFYSWGDGVGSRAPDAGLPQWDGTCVGWRRAATAGGGGGRHMWGEVGSGLVTPSAL
jgi:hypothetical protein